MKKRLLATLLTMVMLVSMLAGCSTPGSGDSEEGGDAAAEKIFRYAVSTEPTTLDPTKGNCIPDNELQHYVTEGLVRNTAGKIEDGIAYADQIEISEDGLTYTFHLRDAVWSDGEPITAHDYEYSWKRLVDPATASSYAFIGGYILNGNEIIAGEKDPDELGVKALDEKTLEVKLPKVEPFFLGLIGSSGQFAPVRQDLVEEYGVDFAATADKNVYSGPFCLTKSSEGEWVFEKNENYWNADAIKLDGAVMTYVQNSDTQLSMFEEGSLDWVKVPSTMVEQYKDEAEKVLNGNVDFCYINYKSENEVLQNQNFRLALNYGLNRNEYNMLTNSGTYESFSGLVFTGLQAKGKTYGECYDQNYYPLDGDLEKAKEYLATAMEELSIKDASEIEIEFVTTDHETNKKIAEVLQEQWQKNLGIKVTIRQVTYSDIYGKVYPEHDFEVGYAGWGADYDDAYSYLGDLYHSQGAYNYSQYDNKDVDKLLDDSWVEADQNVRMDMLNEVEQMLMADGALIPLQARNDYYLSANGLTGMNYYISSVNIDWVYADFAE